MRIAIDARAAAEVPAGRGRYVRELLRGLARDDADHTYTLWARERWDGMGQDERFRWELVPAPALVWPLRVGRPMSAGADVCLATTSYLMTARWRAPGAVVVWDFAAFHPGLGAPVGARLERLTIGAALRRSDAFVAISDATRAELEQRYPQAAGRVAVAPPAADARFTAEAAADDGAVLARHGLTGAYVLVTATLEPRKNLPRLIAAFAGLAPNARAGRRLALVGAAGWATDETLRAIGDHQDLVTQLGQVADDDLPALYRGADVFAYVSLYEGFGIPVLEAMSCGTCVVTSGVSSMPEVGGDAAIYVDPLDVADIRRGLAEALGDADARRRRADAGVDRSRAFSWDRTARTVREVLEGAGRR